MKIIVIGNGMVGHKFCEKLLARDKKHEFQITVFGEEPHRAYDRVHLTEYFSGKTAEDLSLVGRDWYSANKIDLYLDDAVVEIDKYNRTITSSRGGNYHMTSWCWQQGLPPLYRTYRVQTNMAYLFTAALMTWN